MLAQGCQLLDAEDVSQMVDDAGGDNLCLLVALWFVNAAIL